MADDLLSQIRLNGAVPRHVAVIMDGNGRWARERSLPRPLGHRAGMKAVREAVEGALEAGVEVLTLFAFSEENWQRPATEISALMQLLEEYIAREVAELKGQGVAVHVLGDRTRLAPGARGAVERIERETRDGARLALNLCISYSSRGELAQAARLLAEEVLAGAEIRPDPCLTCPATGWCASRSRSRPSPGRWARSGWAVGCWPRSWRCSACSAPGRYTSSPGNRASSRSGGSDSSPPPPSRSPRPGWKPGPTGRRGCPVRQSVWAWRVW